MSTAPTVLEVMYANMLIAIVENRTIAIARSRLRAWRKRRPGG